MPDEERSRERVAGVSDLVRERTADEIGKSDTVTDITATSTQSCRMIDVGKRMPVAWSANRSTPLVCDFGVRDLRGVLEREGAPIGSCRTAAVAR